MRSSVPNWSFMYASPEFLYEVPAVFLFDVFEVFPVAGFGQEFDFVFEHAAAFRLVLRAFFCVFGV